MKPGPLIFLLRVSYLHSNLTKKFFILVLNIVFPENVYILLQEQELEFAVPKNHICFVRNMVH